MTEAPQPYQRKLFQFQTFSILVCSVHVSILLYEFDFSDRFIEIHQTLNFFIEHCNIHLFLRS